MASEDSKEGGLLVRAAGQVVELVQRLDSGWINRLTGLGTSRDKRIYAEMEWDPLGWEEIENLYRAGAIHARAVDLPVDECFRAGFEVRIPGDAKLAQAVNAQLDDLDAVEHLQEADRFSEIYGGGLVLIGTKDRSGPPSERLKLGEVDSVDYLNHFSAREAWALDYFGEVNARGYGRVASYQLSPLFGGYTSGWERVHASRALRFDGVRLERHLQQANMGWGDSKFQRIHDTIRDWATSHNGVAHLLADANQGVFKMPMLTQLLTQNRVDVVQSKFAMIDQARSQLRAIPLSGDESFERVSTQFAGIPDSLTRLDFMLSAVLGYPVTVFFGQAPAGLNATGAADLQLFREAMAARQVRKLIPNLKRLVRVIFRSRRGPSKGVEPERWSIVFRPLANMSPTERATYRKTVAEADNIYIQSQVVTPGEIARSRFGGDEYSDETALDPDFSRELPTDEPEDAPPGRRPDDAPGQGAKGEEPPPATQALNGAQVEGMLAIIERVARREIPRETGVESLVTAFPGLIGREQAERMMGEVGRTFFAAPEGQGSGGQ